MSPDARKYISQMSAKLFAFVRDQVLPAFAEPATSSQVATRLGVPKQRIANSAARLAEHGYLLILTRDTWDNGHFGKGATYQASGEPFPFDQPARTADPPRLRWVDDPETYFRNRLGPRAYADDPRDPPTGMLRRLIPPRETGSASSAGYLADGVSFQVLR